MGKAGWSPGAESVGLPSLPGIQRPCTTLWAGKATGPKGITIHRDRLGAHSPIKDQEPGSDRDRDSYEAALPLARGPRAWSGINQQAVPRTGP